MRKINDITDEELKQIGMCGRVGFDYIQVAGAFDLDVDEVEQEFRERRGGVFPAWYQGKMQAELELRQVVLQAAINGSTPMLEKMLRFFQQTEETHRQLEW